MLIHFITSQKCSQIGSSKVRYQRALISWVSLSNQEASKRLKTKRPSCFSSEAQERLLKAYSKRLKIFLKISSGLVSFLTINSFINAHQDLTQSLKNKQQLSGDSILVNKDEVQERRQSRVSNESISYSCYLNTVTEPYYECWNATGFSKKNSIICPPFFSFTICGSSFSLLLKSLSSSKEES